MKVIINNCFGGFNLPTRFMETEGIKDEYEWVETHDIRRDKNLLNYLENGGDPRGRSSLLKVITIPDDATDFIINEYDGVESIIFVVDGKIHTVG